MKTLYKHLISLTLIIFCVIIFTGCDDAEEDDSYSFEIISSDGGFVGYYKLNGASAEEFGSTQLGTSLVYHTFQKNLSSPESILISATASSKDTSSISIYIYEASALVKSVTVSQSDSTVKVTATLTYTFGSGTSATAAR